MIQRIGADRTSVVRTLQILLLCSTLMMVCLGGLTYMSINNILSVSGKVRDTYENIGNRIFKLTSDVQRIESKAGVGSASDIQSDLPDGEDEDLVARERRNKVKEVSICNLLAIDLNRIGRISRIRKRYCSISFSGTYAVSNTIWFLVGSGKVIETLKREVEVITTL